MRASRFRLSLLFSSALLLLTPLVAFADGTRTWEQSRFEELIKGTATGIAIRSTGGLELAPSFKLLYGTPSTYIWAVASDDAGNVYAATGSPARVYRITPDGEASIIFEPQELQVQTLEVGAKGVIYAATAPDGKVYKLEQKQAEEPSQKKSKKAADAKTPEKEAPPDSAKDNSKPTLDPNWTSSVYFAPGTKYIWDLLLDKSGNLFVATGDHGEIYKVTPKGDHSIFFKSDETHMRVLALDAQGNIIAGTDGSGLIYRISPSGEAFVLYSAPKKEITALTLDHDGNIYAAGVGEKKAGGSITSLGGAASVITLGPSTNPAASPAGGTPNPGTSNPISGGPIPIPGGGATGGSDIYRLSPDGSPSRIWTSHEDIVYALAFDPHGQLLAGTGNRGHIYAITGNEDFSDLLKAPASQITGFAKAPGGGLYAASSNLGKIFVLGPSPENEGSYESDVFDAKIFSRWGRVDMRSIGNVELMVRSGNVDNPDRNWSPWKHVALSNGAEMGVPPARYAQWKAVLHSDKAKPLVESVTLNYLPKNVAPEIDDVSVQVGTRYQPITKGISIGSDASSGGRFDAPIPSTHDHDAIGVKWSAHDDNDDQLVYSVYYRGDGETRWLLLKDNITDKAYSFDASLLPDGGYTVKVVVSDAPSHSPGEALTAEKVSRRFEVDTTPPRIENLTGNIENAQVHVTFRAEDNFSTIRRAEYSIDASDWKYLEPVGQVSDAKMEDYDFTALLDSAKNAAAEHVVVVRVYDKYDNMGAAKTVLHSKE